MPARPQAYYRPSNLDEALTLLRRPGFVPLAGGTYLLASESGITESVVDLQDLGLSQVALGDGLLRIGATARLTDLDEFLAALPAERDATPLLRGAIRLAGPNTYRNSATVGGIIASRLPDSELLAALLALDSHITLLSPVETIVSVSDYLATEDAPQGLITNVIVPWAAGLGRSERVARTPADYPIVSVTAWLPDGAAPRLAATGISARPRRLWEAETHLAGRLDEAAIDAASAAARAAVDHPGDFRGRADYRAEMAAVLTRRVLRP